MPGSWLSLAGLKPACLMLDKKFAAIVCLSGKWSGCLKTLMFPVLSSSSR
jgi:hypothetical protein